MHTRCIDSNENMRNKKAKGLTGVLWSIALSASERVWRFFDVSVVVVCVSYSGQGLSDSAHTVKQNLVAKTVPALDLPDRYEAVLYDFAKLTEGHAAGNGFHRI